MTDRYTGRPFLPLLEGFVLDAIGALDAAEDAALTARDPHWRATVVLRMQFPQGMSDAIRQVWESGRKKYVAANGHDPDPRAFAQHFIDSKFPQ